MAKIMIIGATGSIGRAVRTELLQHSTATLTLYSRSADRVQVGEREIGIAGSATDVAALTNAMQGQDAVFVALSGDLPTMAQAIVTALHNAGVRRLVFITSMGIYNEIPASVGASGNLQSNPILGGYRRAADIIEASNLNYTLIRPGWFDNGSADYEVTRKGEAFGGHDVSRRAIADLAGKLLLSDQLYTRESIGINRPER